MVASVNVPHFDLPFRFGADNHAAIVEQDSEADIENCVEAVIRTLKGTRYYVPDFGIEDPTFTVGTIDISRDILNNEPRAEVVITTDFDGLVEKIRVENNGQQ